MTSPRSRDQRNASSNQHLLKSLGCISSIGLLGGSSLLSGIALAEDALVEAPGDGDTSALVEGPLAEAPLAEAPISPVPPVEVPQLIAEAALGVSPAVAFEPVSEPVFEEPAYVEPPIETSPAAAYVEPAPVEPAYVEPAPVEPSYEESYSETAPADAYAAEPAPLPAPDLQAPVVELTPADLAAPTEETYANDGGLGAGGSGAVIDTTDLYSTGATSTEGVQQIEQPPVVVTEREPAGGSCDQTLQADGLSCDAPTIASPAPAAGNSGVNEIAPPTQGTNQLAEGDGIEAESDLPTVILSPEIVSNPGASTTAAQAPTLPSPAVSPTTQVAGSTSSSNGYSVTIPSKLKNPLTFAVQSLGRSFSQSMDAASYYARTQRPSAIPGNGDRSLLYPMSVPSPVSSVFGWRMHPIHNTWRFHSGTDFAAEQGTPIVAPLSGVVSLADFVGGYGLTVTVDHTGGKTQTLFGHMSELFVRPGQYVRQGEVIGRVGNTGNSTGPHLHFEVRKQDAQGSWVAMDPGQYLEGSLAQLMQVLRNEPLQLSPIPIAQTPFKIQPSLSTGLLPLLQQPQEQQQQPIAINPATPLERAVVQVVKSLEGQPNQRIRATRSAQRQQQTVSTRTIPQTGFQALSSALPQVPATAQQPVVPQQPQKLSKLNLD